MYKKILVAVEHSGADRTILTHVTALARLTGAELLLVHVADGWAARNFDRLQEELGRLGLSVRTHLAMGDPSSELVRVAEEQGVDLVAMSTHGHRFLSDVIHGATADRVRHLLKVPVLLLRAQ